MIFAILFLIAQIEAAHAKSAILLVEHPSLHSVEIIGHYASEIRKYLEAEGFSFIMVESLPAWLISEDFQCRDAAGRENIRQEIEKSIKEGEDRFFNSNDISGAIPLFEKAVNTYIDHPGAAADKKELPEMIYKAGVSLVRLYLLAGKDEKAEVVRDYLARLFPGRIPDISIVPPEVINFFKKGKGAADECFLKVNVHPDASAPFATHLINGIRKQEGESEFAVTCGNEITLQTIFKEGVSFKRKITPVGETEVEVFEVEGRLTLLKTPDYLRAAGLNSNDAMLDAADFFKVFLGAEVVVIARFEDNGSSGLDLEVFSAIPEGKKLSRLSKTTINIGDQPYPALFPDGISGATAADSGRLFTYIALGASIASLATGAGFNIKASNDLEAINNGSDRFSQLSSDKTLMYSFYGAGAIALAVALVLYFIEGK